MGSAGAAQEVPEDQLDSDRLQSQAAETGPEIGQATGWSADCRVHSSPGFRDG